MFTVGSQRVENRTFKTKRMVCLKDYQQLWKGRPHIYVYIYSVQQWIRCLQMSTCHADEQSF